MEADLSDRLALADATLLLVLALLRQVAQCHRCEACRTSAALAVEELDEQRAAMRATPAI